MAPMSTESENFLFRWWTEFQATETELFNKYFEAEVLALRQISGLWLETRIFGALSPFGKWHVL